MRLDVYLAEKGDLKSRSAAAKYIKEGLVSVNGRTDVKPSLEVDGSEEITVTGRLHDFVGRGGLKLEGALEGFGIDVSGMTAVDIGASTGGFTDCLLKRGAAYVVAVDSGHGQLAPELEADPRVRSVEGFNARNLDRDTVGFLPQIAVCDVSFISQTLILPAVAGLLPENGIYIGLIKPQFECGRAALGKGGIVKDPKDHKNAVRRVTDCASSLGLSVIGVMPSPVTGGDGNREFLIYAKKCPMGMSDEDLSLACERICK